MRPDRMLYRDYPVDIRRLYEGLSQARELHNKHNSLLELAELALYHLASLSLSDYRARCATSDSAVEVFLERIRSRSLALGLLLELMRKASEATPEPLIPDPGEFTPCPMPGVAKLVRAVEILGAEGPGEPRGQEAQIRTVGRLQALAESGDEAGAEDWWDGWKRIVEYRNKVAHAGANGLPIRVPGFLDVMTRVVHDALVDLLTEPAVSEAVLDHPIATLTRVTEVDRGCSAFAFCGEDRGIWFEEEVIAEERFIEQWRAAALSTDEPSAFVLDRFDDGWAVRAPFWDLRTGLPPALQDSPADDLGQASPASGAASAEREQLLEGEGTAPGTCGEFAQGVLPDGTPFHVTCPINKSATVKVGIRRSQELSVNGLAEHQRKLGLAIEATARVFDLGEVEITVQHWSDLDVGKGMGSSTADVLAGIRAVADAADRSLSPAQEGELAAHIESSDGSMYPGLAAVNHRTCELIRSWDWFPEFAIVMLVPHESVDTASISFRGQEDLASEYQDLLSRMDEAIDSRSIDAFAEQSTRSAILNEPFLLNPYCQKLSRRLGDFGALGINTGHTGTVCGLLYPNSEQGRMRASEAWFEVQRIFPDLKDVKVVLTPHCDRTVS